MTEIVAAVERVTGLMAELNASTSEQGDSIGQVNQAIARLDEMTQQNASLIEQSAAASQSLREQAAGLDEVVKVFLITGDQRRREHLPEHDEGVGKVVPGLQVRSLLCAGRPQCTVRCRSGQ
ncbi:hypothetical protein [Variovorax sp. DT-64]|uniref:hypothetical protein n=1 Tax=Variovorax sp. DT-64 TaxID=3396160 RepID=UPI003F1A5149